MRLTLRTLLAYLDEILDPADSEELAAKIRESDFASGLVHRIRNSVGRVRLSAPQVVGKGMAADANTVAEYLDNTLPTERVPDFEKVCLESDMHLAEVAASHEILTLVLGEPVTTTPELRERVYALAKAETPRTQAEVQRFHRVDAAVASRDLLRNAPGRPASTADAHALASPAAMPAPAARSSAGAWWLAVAVLIAAVVIAVLTIPRGNRVVAPDEVAMQRQESAGLSPPTTGSGPADALRTPPSPRESLVPSPTESTDIYSLPDGPPIPKPERALSETNGKESAGSRAEGPGEANRSRSDLRPSGEAPNFETGDSTPEIAPLSDAPPLVTNGGSSPRLPKMENGADELSSLPGQRTDRNDGTDVAKEALAADTEEAVAASLIALRQIVAVETEDGARWRRAESTTVLAPGTKMLVPEIFRPRVTANGTIEITIHGPAEFENPSAASSDWQFDYGRFVLTNMGGADSPLSGNFGGRQARIILADTGSVALVEVRNTTALGGDPTTAPRSSSWRVWAVRGELTVAFPDGRSETIDDQHCFQVNDSTEPIVLPEGPPDWFRSGSVRDIDRQAARLLESLIGTDESLEDALQGAFADRRTDVRSLAARCLACLNDFRPLIRTFGDPKFHASWEAHFRLMRELVQRDGETAARIRDALNGETGREGDQLFRILWGFRPEQLEAGAARKLVNSLESPSLPGRVFAIEALNEITGTHGRYRADYHSNRRKEAIRGWHRRLDGGQIIPGPVAGN